MLLYNADVVTAPLVYIIAIAAVVVDDDDDVAPADAIATFSINCLATKLSFKVLEKSLTSKVQIIDVQNLLFPMTKEERKLV